MGFNAFPRKQEKGTDREGAIISASIAAMTVVGEKSVDDAVAKIQGLNGEARQKRVEKLRAYLGFAKEGELPQGNAGNITMIESVLDKLS